MRNRFKDPGIILVLILGFFTASCNKNQIPVLTTSVIADIKGTSATSGGTITDDGSGKILAAGVCWGTGSTPTISGNKTTDPVVTGSFTSNISGLNGATKYYVRSYATNSAGTGYGNIVSFSTMGEVPAIGTWELLEINNSDAELSVHINPHFLSTEVTFEFGTTTSYGNSVTALQSPVTASIDTILTVSLTGLTSGITYHFRIKAENSIGTTYTDDLSFATTITGNVGSISDFDGNTYNTIGVGYQMWMAENLNTTRYNDGTEISQVADSTSWAALTTAAYCDYNNDPATSAVYGKLYNWFVVTTLNSKNVCPAGWHVPAGYEWNTLIYYLSTHGYNYDGSTSGNKIAKSLASATTWSINSSTPGTPGNSDYPSYRNKSGFTALGGGFRSIASFGYIAGGDGYMGKLETWWSSSEKSSNEAWNYWMDIWSVYLVTAFDNKVSGMHIRCLKDN